MASWHQNRNPAAIASLWTPEPTAWKCISDKRGAFASAMLFDTEQAARAYAEKTGDFLIHPKEATA